MPHVPILLQSARGSMSKIAYIAGDMGGSYLTLIIGPHDNHATTQEHGFLKPRGGVHYFELKEVRQ